MRLQLGSWRSARRSPALRLSHQYLEIFPVECDAGGLESLDNNPTADTPLGGDAAPGGPVATAEEMANMQVAGNILPPWARKPPKITEVLPLLYLHGMSER